MGLPLYRAPVESDIKTKVAKDPPTRARSTIRRTPRRAVNENAYPPGPRFYARRHGRFEPSGPEPPWTAWDDVAPAENAPSRTNAARLRRAATLHDSITNVISNPAPGIRPSRMFGLPPSDADMPPRYLSSSAQYEIELLRGAATSRPHTETPNDVDETNPITVDGWFPSSQTPPSWEYPRPSDTPRNPDDTTQELTPDVVVSQDGHLVAMRRLRAVRAARIPVPAREPSQPRSQAQPPVDGLGDRNRSLSPEDEGVWDTLLSSITPDPQPPSVGNSFASTSAPASGAASQNTETSTRSSHTHTTAPSTIEALEFDFEEHPCESGGDNSDTEAEDEYLSQLTEARRFERTYADAARAHREEDELEIMGGVESMQRIVRNLARREDIPDEWWAEAGLNRSLQREAT